jgi:hypothetical protein
VELRPKPVIKQGELIELPGRWLVKDASCALNPDGTASCRHAYEVGVADVDGNPAFRIPLVWVKKPEVLNDEPHTIFCLLCTVDFLEEAQRFGLDSEFCSILDRARVRENVERNLASMPRVEGGMTVLP